MTEIKERERWHLDKRLPVALLTGLAMQLAGFVWVTSKAFSDIEHNASDIDAIKDEIRSFKNGTQDSRERIIRIEGRQENVLKTLQRIEKRLER